MRRTSLARCGLVVGGLAMAIATASAGRAKELLSAYEALALAFPGCEVERHTVYLTVTELASVRELAGTEAPSAVVHPYVALRGERLCGTAYLDVHRVRTLAETVLIAIDADGSIARVEVLAFDEPLDYLPRRAWYERFAGRSLDERLEPGRAVPPVTGASLTARATSDAARRALAVHQLIAARDTVPAAITAPSSGTRPRTP